VFIRVLQLRGASRAYEIRRICQREKSETVICGVEMEKRDEGGNGKRWWHCGSEEHRLALYIYIYIYYIYIYIVYV
jgi:hypothetical protein